MLRAECPRCGQTYFGWTLMLAENTWCECGARLEIEEVKNNGEKKNQGDF